MPDIASPERLAAAAPRFTPPQIDHLRELFAPMVAAHTRATPGRRGSTTTPTRSAA
jgi:hypothetical protein